MSDTVYLFLLKTGGPTEPLDITGGTLRFHGTPVEKHCGTESDCRSNGRGFDSRLSCYRVSEHIPPDRPVLNLPTPERWKAELTQVTSYIPRWFICTVMVTHPSTNPAMHGRELNSQPVDHESDALTTTPPSRPMLQPAVLCVLQCTCLIRKIRNMPTRPRFVHAWNIHPGLPVHSGLIWWLVVDRLVAVCLLVLADRHTYIHSSYL